MVLHFTFRFMIHAELILWVLGIYLDTFYYLWMSSCSITHFLKRLSFLHYIAFPLVKDQLTIFMQVYFWALYSVPWVDLSILSLMQPCPERYYLEN